MNPVKKLYCRTFQTVFKIALPFLPYRKPKVVGSVKALPDIILKKKCSKVLIITDRGIRKLGLTRRLEKALDAAGIPCIIYDKTVANPTTAGTGSETTLAAVITDAQTRYKYAINDFPLIPRYAVLDPKVTLSLPPFITATTGMDALTHAVEAYIGNSTTYGTRKDALLAVKLIFENIDAAYEDGSNVEARRNMLHASFYAGCAFTKSYVGYVHAIAHSLGGEYNVPHGLANAVILPMLLEAYGEKIYKKLARLAIAAGLADEDTPCSEAAGQFIRAVKDMKKRFGIGVHIPEIQETDIPKLAHYADKEANPLYPVPVLMDVAELESFYRILMTETGETSEETIVEKGDTGHDRTGN